METVISQNLFYLIHLHYNYISIIDRQDDKRYRYVPGSIKWNKDGYYQFQFEIEDRDEIVYDRRSNNFKF